MIFTMLLNGKLYLPEHLDVFEEKRTLLDTDKSDKNLENIERMIGDLFPEHRIRDVIE